MNVDQLSIKWRRWLSVARIGGDTDESGGDFNVLLRLDVEYGRANGEGPHNARPEAVQLRLRLPFQHTQPHREHLGTMLRRALRSKAQVAQRSQATQPQP